MTNIFGYQQRQIANARCPWETPLPIYTMRPLLPTSMCIFKAATEAYIPTYIHAIGGVHGLPGFGFWSHWMGSTRGEGLGLVAGVPRIDAAGFGFRWFAIIAQVRKILDSIHVLGCQNCCLASVPPSPPMEPWNHPLVPPFAP